MHDTSCVTESVGTFCVCHHTTDLYVQSGHTHMIRSCLSAMPTTVLYRMESMLTWVMDSVTLPMCLSRRTPTASLSSTTQTCRTTQICMRAKDRGALSQGQVMQTGWKSASYQPQAKVNPKPKSVLCGVHRQSVAAGECYLYLVTLYQISVMDCMSATLRCNNDMVCSSFIANLDMTACTAAEVALTCSRNEQDCYCYAQAPFVGCQKACTVFVLQASDVQETLASICNDIVVEGDKVCHAFTWDYLQKRSYFKGQNVNVSAPYNRNDLVDNGTMCNNPSVTTWILNAGMTQSHNTECNDGCNDNSTRCGCDCTAA